MKLIDTDPWKFTWHNFATLNWRGISLSYQQAQLMFILTLHSRRDVYVGEIIEFLWPDPDDEPKAPIRNIHQHATQLRKKFHKTLIISNRHGSLYLARPKGA